jgi:hypothetical protein
MPEIRYTMKVKYGYVQEWEFEAENAELLEAIISCFAEFLKKPAFEDVDIVITPYILEEKLSEEELSDE